MRVVVTGGAGYIGSHTAKELARSGYEPVILDDLRCGYRRAVKWGPLIEMDLADRNGLRQVFQGYPFEAFVHLVAWLTWESP